jgi:diguanylate cyclase (GGDEF)-like protein
MRRVLPFDWFQGGIAGTTCLHQPSSGKQFRDREALMQQEHANSVRILFVEDLDVDMERELYQLQSAGVKCISRRVETAHALRSALDEFNPEVVLSDFSLPQFDGMSALQIVRELRPEVPFIFVSGTIGEERAISALHAGAVDYVLKENLARLAPAVRRAIEEAGHIAERKRQEAQIARLNRVLRMLGGVNGLVLRIRDRTELLRETCRLAVSVGGYAAAVAAAKVPGLPTIQPVAWSGLEDELTRDLCSYVAQSTMSESGVVGKVVRSGKEFVCNNTGETSETLRFDTLMVKTGMRSVVVLPLVVDGTPIGVLLLAARDSGVVAAEELEMLREVAGNLSFGLQYMQRDNRARFLSHFDSQTGLAKRPLFCERVQRMVSAARRSPHHAVVMFDIERLSIINDSFGRRTGDLLLQHVADRLKQGLPHTDQVAHIGGGTFALVVALETGSVDQAQAVGREQTQKLFGDPFAIEGRSIPVAIRSGFALSPQHGADAMTLVQNAEAALRLARASGNIVVPYSSAAHSENVGRLELEHRLHFALERREFELFYQPKVNVITRRLEGAEALLRWRSPQDGLLTPGSFLPLLESVGLIVPVGEWVIAQAAQDCLEWMRAGLPPIRVAVNVSPAQLRHPDFERCFSQAVAAWSGGGRGLDIEITESMLNEDSLAEISTLSRLRAAGVRMAIDDFGTGYSSLSRLSALPIDTLKIDRSFIHQLVGSPTGTGLVKTVIALARNFNMTTVAEGVEKQEELDLLWHLGCDQSQGYLHSPPLPKEEFASLMAYGKGLMVLPPEQG